MSFFVTSAPKSGTHLLSSMITAATSTPAVSVKPKHDIESYDYSSYDKFPNLVGHFRVSHVQRNHSLRSLFYSRTVLILIRDPLDICNSMYHYVLSGRHSLNPYLRKHLSELPFEQAILSLTDGFCDASGNTVYPGLQKHCSGFVELQKEFEGATVLRYEDFFHPTEILPVLSRIFSVSIEVAEDLLIKSLRNDSITKRQSGATPFQWRTVYSRELQLSLIDKLRDTRNRLGYY